MGIYKLQEVSREVKQTVVDMFNSEWSDSEGIVYTIELLEKTWMRTDKDIMLIMIDSESGNGDVIGTIGLDHKYIVPIASHLYVAPRHRGKGYSDILVSAIEAQTDRKMYAWCKPEKVKGNERRGWIKTRLLGMSSVMPLVPMYKYGTKSS